HRWVRVGAGVTLQAPLVTQQVVFAGVKARAAALAAGGVVIVRQPLRPLCRRVSYRRTVHRVLSLRRGGSGRRLHGRRLYGYSRVAVVLPILVPYRIILVEVRQGRGRAGIVRCVLRGGRSRKAGKGSGGKESSGAERHRRFPLGARGGAL